MRDLLIVFLVCFSILDTAILVPWVISRRQKRREAEHNQTNEHSDSHS